MLMPAEVAARLDISVSTLRKYILLLEENGMEFERTKQNTRRYKEDDVIALQKMIDLMNVGDTTVQNAACNVATNEVYKPEINQRPDMPINQEYPDDEMTSSLINEINILNKRFLQQEKVIENFQKEQKERNVCILNMLEELCNQIKELHGEKFIREVVKEQTIEEIMEQVVAGNEIIGNPYNRGQGKCYVQNRSLL